CRFSAYILHSALSFFLLHRPSPTALYTLSLHDALPICGAGDRCASTWIDETSRCRWGARRSLSERDQCRTIKADGQTCGQPDVEDRKSTRLNSSHVSISYAVFCLKKKKKRLPMIN